jgi:type II secretory pathway pseudopilin PulG
MRRVRRSDRGETLLELLVTISIMSIAVVAIVGAIATSIRLSDVHRKQTVARGYLTAFAESIQVGMASSTSGYIACANTNGNQYDPLFTAPPAPYTRKVVSVEYFNAASLTWSSSGCTSANDSGVQRLQLRVWIDPGTVVNERMYIVIRRPCRPGELPVCT